MPDHFLDHPKDGWINFRRLQQRFCKAGTVEELRIAEGCAMRIFAQAAHYFFRKILARYLWEHPLHFISHFFESNNDCTILVVAQFTLNINGHFHNEIVFFGSIPRMKFMMIRTTNKLSCNPITEPDCFPAQ